MMLSDVSLSVAYIGPKSRTDRSRKTKIGTDVAHITRDSDTSFKIKRSKVEVTGAEAYFGGLPHIFLLLRALYVVLVALFIVKSSLQRDVETINLLTIQRN